MPNPPTITAKPLPLGPITPKRRKGKNPLTPKRRALLHALVYDGASVKDAAIAANLSPPEGWRAVRDPTFRAAYENELQVLRSGERPRNLLRGIDLRDNAKSPKVQLEAAKWLHGESGDGDGGAVTVNVGINVTPGYIVAIPSGGRDKDRVREILHQAQSTDDAVRDE